MAKAHHRGGQLLFVDLKTPGGRGNG